MGYCWRESRAKIVIVKTKMHLLLGKKHLGNEQIYRKWMSAKFWIEMKATQNTQNYEKTQWHWVWKGFHGLCTSATQKQKTYSFAQVALAMRFKKNSLFTWKTDIALVSHRFASRAISVFCVKFNMEFTCQAVNFSVIYRLISTYLLFFGEHFNDFPTS